MQLVEVIRDHAPGSEGLPRELAALVRVVEVTEEGSATEPALLAVAIDRSGETIAVGVDQRLGKGAPILGPTDPGGDGVRSPAPRIHIPRRCQQDLVETLPPHLGHTFRCLTDGASGRSNRITA